MCTRPRRRWRLPGDQVKLVAFDVGEGRPAGLVGLHVAEPHRTQAQQALRLGLELVPATAVAGTRSQPSVASTATSGFVKYPATSRAPYVARKSSMTWPTSSLSVTGLPISAGWAGRPMMVVAPRASMRSGAAPPVTTGPGAMALTRTPAGLNSAAQERVIATMVALAAP